MDHPLLLDMAIHQLDSARFLLDSDPVAVYCEEYNPAWSWYRGDAGCTAIFEMSSGARYVFTGTWCSPGLETSWNGSWRASAEYGSAAVERRRRCRWSSVPSDVAAKRPRQSGIWPATALPARCGNSSGRCGPELVPMGEVHDNVYSLAMVEAAIESNAARRPGPVEDSMSRALDRAIAEEEPRRRRSGVEDVARPRRVRRVMDSGHRRG